MSQANANAAGVAANAGQTQEAAKPSDVLLELANTLFRGQVELTNELRGLVAQSYPVVSGNAKMESLTQIAERLKDGVDGLVAVIEEAAQFQKANPGIRAGIQLGNTTFSADLAQYVSMISGDREQAKAVIKHFRDANSDLKIRGRR